MPTPTRDAEAGAVRRARHAGAARRLAALDAAGAVRTRGRGHRSGDAAARAGLGAATCTVIAVQAVPDQDWVRLTQSQFAPVEITPSSGSCRAGTSRRPAHAGDPPRPRPGLRHRHAPDHAHVPALDRRRMPIALAAACSTTAAAPASWRSARRCTARRGVDAVDIDPAAVEATQANAEANGVRLQRRAAGAARRPLRAGAGQHPGHAAEAAGAAAVRAHVAAGGDLVLAGILERQADELQRPTRPGALRSATAKTAGSDDGDAWLRC